MPTVMEEFELLEISAVDRPAQAHAKAVIIKRDGEEYKTKGGGSKDKDKKAGPSGKKPMELGLDEEDEEKKGEGKAPKKTKKMETGVLVSNEEGHTHLLHFGPDRNAGETSHNSGSSDDMGHSHPWAMNSEGMIEVGMADGHTHSVSMEDVNQALLRTLKYDSDESTVDETSDTTAAAAASQEAVMPEAKKNEEIAELQAQNDDLTKRAERAEAVAALKSDERAHFDGLDEAAQDEFLGKSEDERVEIVKAAGDADPVVYKSADGVEFRQSDDPRLVKMAKDRDEDRAILKAEREQRETLELEKRADEVFPNLPGTAIVRGQLLKAVEGIEDEEIRKGALEALKSANGGIFERASDSPESHGLAKGAGIPTGDPTAETELEQLVKSYQTEHNVTEAKAWDEVLKSDEGASLYRKSTEGAPLAN